MIARLLLLLSLLLVAPVSRAGFDPVMEDIDIFMTNPSIASERPNVLIILDTSANWGSYFATEKSALISVVNGLTDQYNVGLAHNAGGNIEGSYVRYAVRQMGSTNKTALSSMVNALSGAPSTSGGDKTNNSVAGLSLAEAYRYFKGLTSYSATTSNAGHAEKTDYSGNATNSYITSLAGNAFATTPTTTSTYASPVTDGCQRNFIIYISNGKGSNQVGEKTTAMNLLATAKNDDVTATGDANTLKISPLSPSGNETDSWFDEWAKFLAQTGFSMTVGSSVRTITAQTYVVEVNPGAQSADQQWTATLKSGASKGKGKYFAATGDDPGASLLEALNAIFNEIQAVNSVFASTTLPVSVNVRGTNLNQVYIGMFRPDANKAPRWFGNLKLYKLALAADNKTLQMVDAAGSSAESNTTGFIVDTARSFWTIGSDFWSFRTEEENGQGGQSDSPDGDLVEKGAVAQQLRLSYASSQAARKLYTCTTGTYAGQCAPCTIAGAGTAKTCGSSTALSTTPFSTVNTDITTINLGLGTKDIASLSAKVTKSVTGIADRRNVAISNSLAGSKSITAIANGATSKTLSSLTPFDISKSMSISSLTAFGSATGTISVSAKSSSGSSVTLTFSQSGNPCSGKDTVVVAGNHASVNGTWSITSSAHISNNPARSSVTFTVTGTPDPNTQGTVNCMSKTTTATATVSSLPAGLTNSSRILISGASPSAFNGNFQVNGVSGNTFTYTIGSSQGVATTAGTLDVYNTVSGGSYSATASTVRVTGTTTANHGYVASNSVTLTGVTPSTSNGLAVYNSPVTLATASGATFTYDMSFAGSSNGYPPAAATAFGSVYAGATTTVTITSAAHGFPNLSTIDITGINSCYNVTGASLNYIGVDQFSYTTASACPPLSSIPVGAAVSGSSYSNTITATLASHGYAAGDQIIIANGTNTAHHGTFTVVTPAAVDPASSTFTYTNTFGGNPPSGPSGQYTVRLATNPLVYVTAPGHGFTTSDSITIAGAVPAGYNGTRTITRIDDDSFTFANTSGTEIGAYVSGTVTASENTTTARATSVNHGFANNASVVISGAVPNDFNGTFTIAYVDANTFTYPILTAQGDASGTIVAAAGSGSSSERDQIINWVRGQDNQENENSNGVTTDCRASVHGDVLHSRPAVINYNRYGGDNDVYIFYGANDGVFHAIKGGYGTDSDDNNGLSPGQEAWGFVPTEGFSNLKRLRNNSPVIGSSFKRPYFLDGPIGIYSVDGNADGKILAASATDHVYLYVGARRGGRYMYSLDVTNPTAPAFRWKIDNSVSGFEELGYTWSLPQPVSNINARTNPVLIFGGGYDPQVEDIENCTITATSAASYNAGTGVYTPGTVTYSAGTITYASTGTGCTVANPVATTKTRGMGRALYVVDAVTGEKIWSASYRGSGADLEVAGMDFAIPSDITVIKNTTGGKTNRAYVGDTGGNMWRFDFNDINPKNWTITKIASISTLSAAANRRKFLYPPDVVSQVGYDAIMVGAGDREHPFDNTVTNRFYLFKDRGSDLGPGTGDTHYLADSNSDSVGETLTVNSRTGVAAGSGNPVISHSPTVATDGELYDATNNCVQEACSGSTAAEKAAAKTAQANLISAADGWFITLGVGEKVIGNAVALNGIVFFNTNQPSQEADASCVGNLGIARQYQVQMADAGAWDPENTGTKTKSDRSSVHAGGGYLPSPVHVVVQVEDSEGNLVTKEGVISGTEVQTPTTGAIGSRTRRYWYKEID
jgi:Tfp pilus tip-associated adhesin PilY1